MRQGAVRLAASLSAAAFALSAIFSGLDRYSEHSPGAVRLVPEMVRIDALRVGAAQALSDEDAGGAEDLATAAVWADPQDARGPAFLGAAQLLGGKRTAAREAFSIAAKMSLREPLVQAYFFDEALERGDFAAAALQLDILLRAHPNLARVDYFFAALEASEQGRAELARRLVGEPRWSAVYLGDFRGSDDVLRARARFLAGSGRGIALPCNSVEPLVTELTRRNFRADAKALSAAHCGASEGRGVLADAQFENFGSESGRGWRRHGSGDVRISPVGENDRAVEIENRAGVTRLVLSQPVALDEGEYRFFASVAGAGTDRVLVSLSCGSTARPSSDGGALARGQLVSAPDCPDQVLGVWLRPGSGAVRLDDMRVEKVGDQTARSAE